MKNGRSILVMASLALLGSCHGSDGTGPGNTKPVASIAVGAVTSTSVSIGASIVLTAQAYDATGGAIAGQTYTWSSSDSLVAKVSQSGSVTGVSAGTASITAAIGTVKGQNTVSVFATTDQLSCSTATPVTLNVGEIHQVAGAERSSLCVTGGAGSEYALVAFNSSLDTSTTIKTVSLVATNTVPVANGPTPQLAAPAPISARLAPRDYAFERRLREMERRELDPRILAPRAAGAGRSFAIKPPSGISAITGVPSTPAVGSVITLNANATSACGPPTPHGATVVAVSTHAIVAVDTLVPPNGFTTADYQGFAAAFDTLIFPLDTLNYGVPTDIDNNGRALLFFSQVVNQLSNDGSGSYVGGFFFARDLFPLTNTATLAACQGSNVGEMFYLPALDPNAVYNHFFTNRKTVTAQLLSTVVHEFQHQINAGRHLYVNTAAPRLEESWLDESLAMLAQELLYFHVSGFAPKQKLNYATISAGANSNGTQLDIIQAYLVEGLGALNFYLQVPETSSPYNNSENLATLGSGMEFVRYLLDQTPGTQPTMTRALDNAIVTGFANLQNVFSISNGALANSYQAWAVAQYVDGTGLTTNAAYSNPSWNYRDVVPKALGLSGGFPLKVRPLLPTAPASLALRGGAASYIRFRVNAGVTAQITPANGTPASTDVRYALVRTF